MCRLGFVRMVGFEGIWQDNSVLVSSGTLAIEYWWLVWYDISKMRGK